MRTLLVTTFALLVLAPAPVARRLAVPVVATPAFHIEELLAAGCLPGMHCQTPSALAKA